MSAFVNPFVSGRYPRLVAFAIWLVLFLILLTAGALLWRAHIKSSLNSEVRTQLQQFDVLHTNMTKAFAKLHRTVTAEPCSEMFLKQLRRVAFDPDGLNEFMYAPDRVVACSTSVHAYPGSGIPLGAADIEGRGGDGISLWVNKELDTVGVNGGVGTVAYQAPFALVVPNNSSWEAGAPWLATEYVIRSDNDHQWHLSGAHGVFDSARSSSPQPGDSPFAIIRSLACGDNHNYCVAGEANIADIAMASRNQILVAIGLIAFYAIWPASIARRTLERYWSFESRFCRNLSKDSIVCTYQPIMDLRTGEIAGCEVLARWRDVDGSLVFPDKFIGIVEKGGKTLTFTQMVAERAYDELSQLPENKSFKVNFNIFPRDFNCEKLLDTFRAFEQVKDRFPLVLEIVESDALAVEDAQREIEALAQHGIHTYIDDFGSGYSNIHRVASLAVHGVKLDRSFAMAPADSLMSRMLVHAIDMIGSSGCEIVVEGIETQERLEVLMGTKQVAFAQGYLISRPLRIEQFAQFLAGFARRSLVVNAQQAAAA